MKDYSPKAPPPDSSRTAAGFRAHLQGVSLHDLVTLQHLTRASGVYVVLSGERSGVLHFAQGTLFHAETTDGAADVIGNRAAVEILSWPDGEFLTSTQRAAERATVSLTIGELIGTPEVGPDARRVTATGIRPRLSRSAPGSASEQPAPREAASPTGSLGLAAVATPGTALSTPRLVTRPGEARTEVQVLVSPRGELVDGRGAGAESLAGRVAYVTRLAELIGQAMGSGEAYGLRVRGPSGELEVRRRADGHIAGSFGPADGGEPSPPTPIPPPLPASASGPSLPLGSPGGGPQTRRSRTPSS